MTLIQTMTLRLLCLLLSLLYLLPSPSLVSSTDDTTHHQYFKEYSSDEKALPYLGGEAMTHEERRSFEEAAAREATPSDATLGCTVFNIVDKKRYLVGFHRRDGSANGAATLDMPPVVDTYCEFTPPHLQARGFLSGPTASSKSGGEGSPKGPILVTYFHAVEKSAHAPPPALREEMKQELADKLVDLAMGAENHHHQREFDGIRGYTNEYAEPGEQYHTSTYLDKALEKALRTKTKPGCSAPPQHSTTIIHGENDYRIVIQS